MTIFLTIVHILVCFFLIAVVLLQSGKGAELGAAFGGSSQTLFGGRGAATFLGKLTTAAAVVFMLTSFTLAIVTTKGSSVIKKETPVSSQQPLVPTSPAGPLQGTGGSAPAQPSQPGTPPPAPSQGK